ncbi:hypothetical protein IVB33_29975 [Bradyrhizobium sp. 24]|nr:hypothetical protein [Bradyrhizobium sp. 24]
MGYPALSFCTECALAEPTGQQDRKSGNLAGGRPSDQRSPVVCWHRRERIKFGAFVQRCTGEAV